MRKFTALMLSMIMVLALIPAASFAEGEKSFTEQAASTLDTVKRVFKSDENFSTAVGDGTWDNGVWRAELRDEWWNISTATSVYDNKAYISPSGDGWAHEWYPKVSGDIMYPLLQGGESDLKRRAVRTFIAPYSGKIEIKETIIENHANGCQVKYYINKDSQELWTVQSNGGNVTQNTIELDVQQGDLIRFEVEWVNLDGSNEIKWVNTIEYLPEATPTPSPSPTPTATPTPTSTPTPDPASTPTPTPDPALTPTATPTATPTPTPVPTVDPNRNEFSSNENFSTATADGNWDGGIWSAMCYVQDWWIYSDLTNVADGKYNLEWLENGHARVDGNTLETDTTIKNFTVRAFTSPQEGILRIEKATITNASAAAAKVQIRHKANNGDLKHIWKTGATEIAGNETTEQEQIELQVNEGDIIYFEAASASEGTGVIVEWINKLTYIDEFTPEPTPTPTPIPTPEPTPDLNKTVYRASDSWSMEKNGDDVWKWQSYKVALKTYEDLPNKMEGNLMMGDDWSDGPVWLAGEDWRWAAVGKYTMRATVDPGDPTTEETSGDFKVHRDYPVRTFTSPKNGTVSIQVPDNKIWAKDEITGTHIRIMCQRADGSKPIQIFPNAEETDWLNIKGEYNFEPIEFELNAGDKLMFENAFIWKEGGYSPWNTYVQWDPIVEYKTISPKLTGVIPADGEENIALNAEHILNYDGALADISADKLTVYEVNSEGENIKSDAVCSSIAVDGSSVKFVLDGLKPYTKYEAKLDGICYFGFDAKNEKSETITFTTGPAVNIGEAKYENGKVSVPVNNPYKENKTATLIAAVCKGTESKYSIEKTYYVTRRDIGANDVIETEAEFPSDSDYFIKIVVMEDMQKARAYAPSSIIRR